MSAINNLALEEDNKNGITIIEHAQATEQFSDDPPNQTEIQDEQYNASDET